MQYFHPGQSVDPSMFREVRVKGDGNCYFPLHQHVLIRNRRVSQRYHKRSGD